VRGVPLPLGSVLRLSQPLDGFLHQSAHRPISSCSHVQGSSCSGASPFVQLSSLIKRTFYPLVVKRTIAHRPKLASTLVRLNFEALLHTKKRFYGLGLTSPQLAPLVRFLSPPGSSPFSPCEPVPRFHPLMTLPAKDFAHTITSPSRL
jgi:hypothetical protein